MQKFEDVAVDSGQYHTAQNFPLKFGCLTPRSIILRGDSEKFEYLSEDETKKENILTHWSVAQAGSNDETSYRGRKSR